MRSCNGRTAFQLHVSGTNNKLERMREDLYKVCVCMCVSCVCVGCVCVCVYVCVFGMCVYVTHTHTHLYQISMEEPIDLAVQEDDLFRRNRSRA